MEECGVRNVDINRLGIFLFGLMFPFYLHTYHRYSNNLSGYDRRSSINEIEGSLCQQIKSIQ